MTKSLHRLDLNLLFTMQLLLNERSVTKTAKRLSVTPSAVSKSLTKLRDWFDDPLFVRTPQGLQATPLALSMEGELSEWFQVATQIAAKRSSETPKGVSFQLMMESPLHMLQLAELPQRINQQYPDANIKIRNWEYDSLAAIINGEADIGLCGRESHPRSPETLDLLPYFIDYEVLFTDLPLVYLREDHPALDESWNMDTFLKYRHINILWEKTEAWALDEILAEIGLSRNIGLSLSTFEQSLFMAAQANQTMFTTAPSYCRDYIKHYHPNLVTRPLPISAAASKQIEIPITLMWHKRNSHNPKLRWLKETIKEMVAQS